MLKVDICTFIVPTLRNCMMTLYANFVKSIEFPLNSSALNALMFEKDITAGPTYVRENC
jgi:hypothetical protein